MSERKHNQDDPLGLIPRLEEAMENPALDAFDEGEPDSQDALCAAYDLAVALGWCRLAGLEPGEGLDGTLSASMALAAAREIIHRSSQWIADANKLGDNWDSADDPFEKEEILCGALTERMDVWGATAAIDEACLSALTEVTPEITELQDDADRAFGAMSAFDDALYEQRSLLSAILDTNLIENWRDALLRNHRLNLPWWLDGTLEEQARKVEREALNLVPSAKTWTRLHEYFDAPAEGEASLRIDRWLPAATSMLAAASDAAQAKARLGRILRWRNRDGTLEAIIGLVDLYFPHSSLTVSFLHADTGGFAVELADHPVTLAGVAGRIDAEGYARFTHESLWEHSQSAPVLTVDDEQWNRMDEPAADDSKK